MNTSLIHNCRLLLKREFLLALRNRSDLLHPLLFFVIVISLAPIAISPDANILRQLAPGMIWIAALLANLLALDRLFRNDFNDGSLEQLLLAPCSNTLIVSCKIVSHWLLSCVPLLIITPLLGVMLYLDAHTIGVLILTLLLGTPSLCLIGAIGSALTVSVRQGGMLLALLMLPLMVPIIIFGTMAVMASIGGVSIAGYVALLAAILTVSAVFAPLACRSAIELALA